MVWSLLPSSKDRITTWNPYSLCCLVDASIYCWTRYVDKYIPTLSRSHCVYSSRSMPRSVYYRRQKNVLYKKWMEQQNRYTSLAEMMICYGNLSPIRISALKNNNNEKCYVWSLSSAPVVCVCDVIINNKRWAYQPSRWWSMICYTTWELVELTKTNNHFLF